MRRFAGLLAAGAALVAFGAPAGAGAAITPLGQYGTGEAGGDAGQLDVPLDVAVDPQTGDVYVADGNNPRVDVFAPDGTFLRAFGKDVDPAGGTGPEVCTTTCQPGTSGAGAGEFQAIEGVYVSEGGEVFVADYDNDRVSVYTREGQFLRAFGKDVDPAGGTGFEICTTACQAGASDAGPGALADPWAMTIGPADGLLYVTDPSNERISVHTQQGAFVHALGLDVTPGAPATFEACTTACQEGDPDGTAGSLNGPEDVDFAPDGSLWIAEYSGQRITVAATSPAPAFLRAFGKDVDPAGGTGFEVCTTSCQPGSPDATDGAFASPQGVAVDPVGTAYVADSANQRVQAFVQPNDFAFAFGADVDPTVPGTGFEVCTGGCKAGDPSESAGGLDEPYAPADDCHGNVYVTDVDNHRIQRFGEPGTATGPCLFAVESVKRKKKAGTAKVKVFAPGPGTVSLRGKGVKLAAKSNPGFARNQKLKLKPKGKAKETLRETGRKKVKAKLTFDPVAEGVASDKLTQKVKLVRKR